MSQVFMRPFDLQFCAITLSSLSLKGFAAGDAMVAEFPGDDFEFEQGSDGEILWIRKHNAVCNITIRLAQGNPQISQVAALHETSLAGGGIPYPFGAFYIKGDEIISGSAMILNRMPIRWSDSAQPKEIKLGVGVTSWQGGTVLQAQ